MIETRTKSFASMIGDRNFIIETGKLAGQATSAVTVRYGDSVVLVTLTVSEKPREGGDFLPLTIDYEERLYAAGKIPGSFIRREGRPTQEATLASRLTDRSLRPLLPKWWRRDIQIVITVLSADLENDPDILAVIGGSAVLTLSEIPFGGPIGAVRVGYVDGKLVLNPTMAQLENSQLDLVVVGTKQAIVMLEAGVEEVPEDLINQAIEFGQQANLDIIKVQEQLQEVRGKPKLANAAPEVNPELDAAVSSFIAERLAQALSLRDKSEREQALNKLQQELVASLSGSFTEPDIVSALQVKIKSEIRNRILSKGERVDGRGLTEVRPISCEVGLLPRTHGSGLFTRGQTQVLTITTLGPIAREQQLDNLGIEETKRFMHHYNFPPFSTGEVGRIGTPGRREIGHGALAERALVPVIPKDEDFPYTIRLVSEVLSSAGSTSMASVCASSLSLMDAGIPIRTAVAGVAMGLVTDDKGSCAILTDIEGLEDAYGDMDFKVAGTSSGITALQLDIKLKGISMEIVRAALNQARQARLSILEIMNQTISTSRPELSRYAPRMYKITIDPAKIGAVIGTGGKTIRSIIETTKATVDIENDGTVLIGAISEESARKAIEIIEGLTKEVEVGSVYTGKVTRIADFGAFVEVLPGKDGMVHISELADYRVGRVEDVVKLGDEITVKVIGIDDLGRIRLSRKAVFDKQSETPGAKVSGSTGTGYPTRRPQGGRAPPRRPMGRHRPEGGR